jgi:hypothetical protein
MNRRLKQAAVVFVLVFAAAQLVRPSRANPPTDAGRTIQADVGPDVVAVLDRSCSDCHSHQTVWPSYTQVAPLSWLMAYAVSEGRRAVNFSEWASYSPEKRQALLTLSCQDARAGKMPGIYTWLHPEMRLSVQDIDTICTTARQAAANRARGF